MKTRIPRLLGVLALFSLFLTTLPIVTAQPSQSSDKIEGALLDRFSADGVSDFVVRMAEQADLSAADGMRDWNARGQYVYDTLRAVARSSQAQAQEYLKLRGLDFQSFFAGNEIYVWAGDLSAAQALADLPEVGVISAARTYYIDPILAEANPAPQALDWGIVDTKADQFWGAFGVQGDGMLVASIDTGVQWNHPALDQAFKCGTNPSDPACWSDPSNICGGSMCDNNGHGTHTMGTMVGDDDPSLQYQAGMAPNAQWIACKGCESSSCSTNALNACADWIVAPAGNPANRPNVVNNSWGGRAGTCDTWYLAKVQAWVAAGIFPAFSAGNSGSCSTLGVPSVYQESFASAAHDSSRNIASFSSRGPAPSTPPCDPHTPYTKPNISAPGVNICSSVPTNSWSCTYSGTSMASPHTAGAVALLWSCNPSLVGQIDQTFTILQNNANTPPAGNCGAPPDGEGNYTYGYGYLDVLAAGQLWCGDTGWLDGHVTVAGSGAPIANAAVTAQKQGGGAPSTTTDASGYYTMTLMVGTYTVTVEHPLYASASAAGIVIVSNTVTTHNFTMQPKGRLWGYVTDLNSGAPLAATVSADDGTVTQTNPADGSYAMYLDEGTHVVTATAQDYAADSATVAIVSGQDTRQDFQLLAAIAVVPDPIHATLQMYQVGTVGAVITNNMGVDYPFRFVEVPAPGAGRLLANDILLMGDDLTTAYWDIYRASLTAAGVTWDERDLLTQPFPTLAQLAPYTLLIWTDNDVLDPGDADCQVVADWLVSGNKILVGMGRDFLWDLANGTPGLGERNLYDKLLTTYLADYAGTGISALLGVAGDPIGGDFVPPNTIPLAGTLDSNGDYASETSVATTGLLYGAGGAGSGHAALTHYEGSNYKTVWLGLNFHNGITSQQRRDELMAAILGFTIGGDVPWYGTSIVTGTVPAGGSLAWTNYFTATPDVGVTQPGEYQATLRIRPDGVPGLPVKSVAVLLTVLPTANMGQVDGSVLDNCMGAAVEASIDIVGGDPITQTQSDPDSGYYNAWLVAGTYDLVFGAPGYVVYTATVDVTAGQTTTLNVDLVPDRPCIAVDPARFEFWVQTGMQDSDLLGLTNNGGQDLTYAIYEVSGTLGFAGPIPAGRGGPDPFGYTYVDSNEPDGPLYQWVDISTTGTPISGFTDDSFLGPFNIGFGFNFYGTAQTQFFASSNGFLSFGSGSSSLTNQCPLPNATAPNNLIAMMWDDLDPGDTSDLAYYQSFPSCPVGVGSCLVVQYQNFHHYPGGGAIAGTWETILFENGSILLQFKDAGAEQGSGSTTGIEDSAGTTGLSYACDTAGSLTDDLAICFTYPGSTGCLPLGDVPWVWEIPVSGTVPAQSAANVEVHVTSLFTDGSPMPLGTYTATLLVVNDDPVARTQDVLVTMHVISEAITPSASFNSNSPVCLGTDMVFTDTSSNAPTSWEWGFGDGITATVQNPVHLYAAAGPYTVTLEACNDGGCGQASSGVEVLPVPAAGFDYWANLLTVTFTNTSAAATSYLWEFGDGITDTVTNPVHTYAAAGPYTVTLLASGGCGSDEYSTTLTVAECLPANIITVTTDISACVVAFGAEVTGTAPYDYLWDFRTFGTSTATNPLVDFGASGTYPYTLTVSNCGPEPAVFAGSVTVDCLLPCSHVAIITVTTAIEQCVVSFTPQLTGTSPFTYLWAFGDGFTSTLAAPTHVYAASGTYNATLDVWNCAGAGHDVRTFPVTVACQPTYSIYLPLVYKASQ